MRLIDADALHNVLQKKPRWIVRNGDKHNEGYTYDQVHFAIDDMPTIEERKTERWGRWIMHIDDLFPIESTMECSECHKHQPLTCDENFCPNCGAKMEKE